MGWRVLRVSATLKAETDILLMHLCFWYCLLGLFNGKWIISCVEACLHTSVGVIKSLSDKACFHNTPCMSSPTHKHKGFLIVPSFVLPNSTIVFFSVCTLTCIQCSTSACAVLPTVTDVHVFPHGLCMHQIFTIPLWHLAQVQMSWIGKWWLFPLLSLYVDLHWVGDFPAYHTHCLCFVLLIY